MSIRPRWSVEETNTKYALPSLCMTWASDPTLMTRAPREGQGPSNVIKLKKKRQVKRQCMSERSRQNQVYVETCPSCFPIIFMWNHLSGGSLAYYLKIFEKKTWHWDFHQCLFSHAMPLKKSKWIVLDLVDPFWSNRWSSILLSIHCWAAF